MIVREAQVADAGVIADLVNQIVETTTVSFTTIRKSPEGIAREIAARGPAFQVLEAASGIMGFATYFPFRTGPGYATTQEHSIVLAPEAQGQGGGRLLMDALEEVGRANGVHVLIAGVSAENTAGLRFHAAIGFTEVGRLAQVGRKFDRWLDLVLMQKIL